MLILTASLLACHYLADYSHLTRPWMLKAKATGSPILPIISHAMVHVVLMAIVMFSLGVDGKLAQTALLLQLVSHTIIDVVKGKLNVFPAIKNPTNQWHWITFGGDQLLHQLVILWMVSIVSV